MAVSFVAAGTFAGNATLATQDIVAPACSANDILVAAIINKSVTANAVSPPDSTWFPIIPTEVNDCTTAADDHQYSLFWKRATGSGGTFTFTKAVDDNVLFGGLIVAYSGARTVGSPLDPTLAARTETAAAADNVSFPAFDPTYTDVRVIYVAFYGNDLTTFAAAMSADTNPDCTIDTDQESSTGNDCSIAITSGLSDGTSIASRTWASGSTTDAGNTGVVFALVAESLGINVAVPSGADDGYWFGGASQDLTSSFLVIGKVGPTSYNSFARFTSVAIPQGSTINVARFEYMAQGTYTGTTCNVNVYFEAADNPSAITTGADGNGRAVTTAVGWSGVPANTVGLLYATPDISAALQEVVDRAGWASGNALQLLIKDNGSTSAAERDPASFEHASYTPPILHIEFTEPAPAGNPWYYYQQQTQ